MSTRDLGSLYENPERFRFAGAMEGVPEAPAPPQPDIADGDGWRRRGHTALEDLAHQLPGLAIAAALAAAALAATHFAAQAAGFERSPLPASLAAILFGLALRNCFGLPGAYAPGLRFCTQQILRFGVALLGLRLSLTAVGALGAQALPIVVACLFAAGVGVHALARAAGLSPRLGTLIAVGTAICGNSAVAAAGPVLGAKDDEVTYAVGCVTLFGLLALVAYPFLAPALFAGDPWAIGTFLGAAIHDTAQVAGAASLAATQQASPEILDAALVTKLLRNAFLLLVIPLAATWHHRRGTAPGAGKGVRWHQAVPLFVLAFLGLAAVRTLGDLGDAPFGGWLTAQSWNAALDLSADLSAICLALAMAAIGLGTHLRSLRALGARPLMVGFGAAVGIGAVAALGISLSLG
ncbi:MAG: putative sulfate exporter family transporter [Myxococcota bacterium]